MQSFSIILSLASLALARPQLVYTAPGFCTAIGFTCVDANSFTLCDANLTGIIQALAPGDLRCGGAAVPAPPAPAASSAAPAPDAPAPTPTTSAAPTPASDLYASVWSA